MTIPAWGHPGVGGVRVEGVGEPAEGEGGDEDEEHVSQHGDLPVDAATVDPTASDRKQDDD